MYVRTLKWVLLSSVVQTAAKRLVRHEGSEIHLRMQTGRPHTMQLTSLGSIPGVSHRGVWVVLERLTTRSWNPMTTEMKERNDLDRDVYNLTIPAVSCIDIAFAQCVA